MPKLERCQHTDDMLEATSGQRDNWAAHRVVRRREERNARRRQLRRTRRERKLAEREAAEKQLTLIFG